MTKPIQLLLVFFACLSGLQLHAQSRITIESPDSLPFLFSVNDQLVNQLPVLALTLDQPVSGKVNLKADFLHRPELTFSQVVTIKKGTLVNYAIERSKGSLKFILKSESIIDLAQTEIYSAAKPSLADSVAVEARHNGCYPLADDAEYRQMLATADEQHFESKKLGTMTAFTTANCIRVEQLRYMMSKLSQEDSKLALLSASKEHIYDPENMPKVIDEFFLARTKVKAQEIIDSKR
jgi:Domain of unknown function (DUF4476)